MAAPFLSTANTLFSRPSSTPFYPLKVQSFRRRVTLCAAISESPSISKRGLALCFISSFVFSSIASANANAAILEADDDLKLLEKVKTDRKKRLERQGIINSSTKEKGYLQDVVYKLSEVGQDIEKSDLSAAGSVLGGSTGTPEWVKKANVAFNKFPVKRNIVKWTHSTPHLLRFFGCCIQEMDNIVWIGWCFPRTIERLSYK